MIHDRKLTPQDQNLQPLDSLLDDQADAYTLSAIVIEKIQ